MEAVISALGISSPATVGLYYPQYSNRATKMYIIGLVHACTWICFKVSKQEFSERMGLAAENLTWNPTSITFEVGFRMPWHSVWSLFLDLSLYMVKGRLSQETFAPVTNFIKLGCSICEPAVTSSLWRKILSWGWPNFRNITRGWKVYVTR